MGKNVKITLENFGTIKLAHVSYGQAILLDNNLLIKISGHTKGENCSVVSIDTGRVETVSQHLLCIEVECDITVRIKKKSVPPKLYTQN